MRQFEFKWPGEHIVFVKFIVLKEGNMKITSLVVLSVVAASSLAQAKDRYLVQFSSKQGFEAMQNYFTSVEDTTPTGLQKSLVHVNSMVFKTKNTAMLETLKSHPDVILVEAEKFFPNPKPANNFKLSKVAYFETSFKPNEPVAEPDEATPVFKKGPETPWGIEAVKAGEAWELSGAGKNARVAVLDTGVDDKHPALAPNFEKGKNFTENEAGDLDSAAYQDDEGHGTHTAGTVLGVYNPDTGFTGVAPKAKLLAGKVCGKNGCSSIAIVEGINWGIQEKADVISMSLGGPNGRPAERMAIDTAEKAGIVVVAASGNGAADEKYSHDKNDPKCGGIGSFFGNICGVSFPGAFQQVVAVGALNDKLEKTAFSQWGPELDISAPGASVISSVPRGTGRVSKVNLTVNGTETEVKSAGFSGTDLFAEPVINSIVVIPGLGKPEDFAQVDVKDKFALIKRGEIKFLEKVANAIKANAKGVIIYNHSPGLMQGTLSEDGTTIKFPVVMIEQETGDMLVEEITKGTAVSAAISLSPSDYASFDGTSMATPHVAGVVALIRSVNKKLTPAQIRVLLNATAKTLVPNDTNQVGAGIVQADAAVRKAVGP